MNINKIIIFVFSMFLFQDVCSEIIEYRCGYSVHANINDVTKVKDMTFVIIHDTETDKSYLHGNTGSSYMTMYSNYRQTSFIEITQTGNINVTTIAHYPLTIDGTDFNSVHSRNVVLVDELFPSQFYGKCSNMPDIGNYE